MLLACLTVDATLTLEDLLRRIRPEADSMYVVIRRVEADTTYWYAWTVEDLNSQLWSPDQLRSPLSDALQLHEYQAVPAFRSAEGEPLSELDGVLVRGHEALGVLRTDIVRQRWRDIAGTAKGEPPAPPGSETRARPFSAYPMLAAPEWVAPGAAFDLTIGLSASAVAGVAGGLMTATVPARFAFDLQVVADGFTVAAEGRTRLEVERDDFERALVVVPLVAPAVTSDVVGQADIQVLFFYQGNLCGRAIRTITVSDGGQRATGAPVVGVVGCSSVSLADTPAPDLTVVISRGADDTSLRWTLSSPHAVPSLPAVDVATRLNDESAKSFALDLVRNLSERDRSPLTAANLTGVAEQISAAMPRQFWLALDEMWALRAQDSGAVPSVLVVSDDPYVPWELAATTSRYVRSERLDPQRPPFLGAQLRVGRWIPPDPTPFGGDVPVLPPRASAQVDRMVVFAGDYDALSGHRPLPQAVAEATALATRYKAVSRHAVLDDVTALIRDRITEGGEPVRVDAIHFACHGEVSDNPRYNGIVLSDIALRLGADMIVGSRIGRTSEPIVFVNACQLGIATARLDGDYGGLAGAFLDRGATAFISPLWSVDDDVAHEFALDFYEQVYGSLAPVTVGEVLRDLRSRFDTESDAPASSYLAYAYYGHPDLVIHKL